VAGDTTSDQTTFPDGDPNADDLFPVPGPDQTFNGGTLDAYVGKVNTGGTALVYAGYIGGSATDQGNGIAVDGLGNAYVAGGTVSDQDTFPDGDDNADDLFPVPGPDQTYNGGASDGFVAKVEPLPLPSPPPGPLPGPTATCKGATATVEGTAGNDTLTGTAGPDVVASLGGKDTIKTLGGNDQVCAGDGNDSVNGGGGKDNVNGEGGRDKLKGGGGNDKLKGGSGNDTCIGGSGKDRAPGCEKEKSL
jgi:Ca2+-binding RTX toxin-like protein